LLFAYRFSNTKFPNEFLDFHFEWSFGKKPARYREFLTVIAVDYRDLVGQRLSIIELRSKRTTSWTRRRATNKNLLDLFSEDYRDEDNVEIYKSFVDRELKPNGVKVRNYKSIIRQLADFLVKMEVWNATKKDLAQVLGVGERSMYRATLISHEFESKFYSLKSKFGMNSKKKSIVKK
jgi:hypothetical protein